ncbi:hypothetical protein [Dactylosporangium sp. NPDC050588]|uniref:hypothetical protein n=1 Tax=Dactylosporangium sp. NPDC050588 TaxID=3157211 RepID=UPI0033FCA5B0
MPLPQYIIVISSVQRPDCCRLAVGLVVVLGGRAAAFTGLALPAAAIVHAAQHQQHHRTGQREHREQQDVRRHPECDGPDDSDRRRDYVQTRGLAFHDAPFMPLYLYRAAVRGRLHLVRAACS